jgi:hypothetical protein
VERIQVKEARDNRKKRWSGRTFFHGRHRRSVPLGKIRVECKSVIERCRRMSVPWVVVDNPKINKIEKTYKNKSMGVSGQNSSERRDNKKKRVEWTYFEAWSPPPQCSIWKCPR